MRNSVCFVLCFIYSLLKKRRQHNAPTWRFQSSLHSPGYRSPGPGRFPHQAHFPSLLDQFTHPSQNDGTLSPSHQSLAAKGEVKLSFYFFLPFSPRSKSSPSPHPIRTSSVKKSFAKQKKLVVPSSAAKQPVKRYASAKCARASRPIIWRIMTTTMVTR